MGLHHLPSAMACSKLKRPLIELNPQLPAGRWQKSLKRLLELKTELCCPIPGALEVFKRLPIRSSIMLRPAGTSRGPKFREICLELGSSPAASGTYPPLDQRVFSDEEDGLSEESKLVVKVRKLLALSQSANQHEAEQALLKARELTEKYELSIDEQHNPEEFYA